MKIPFYALIYYFLVSKLVQLKITRFQSKNFQQKLVNCDLIQSIKILRSAIDWSVRLKFRVVRHFPQLIIDKTKAPDELYTCILEILSFFIYKLKVQQ